MAIVTPSGSRVLVTAHESELAREALDRIAECNGSFAVTADGTDDMVIPPQIIDLVVHMLGVIAGRSTITLGALPEELTTPAASAILGLPHPTLLKMIGARKMPASRRDGQYRMSADSVLQILGHRRAEGQPVAQEIGSSSEDFLSTANPTRLK